MNASSVITEMANSIEKQNLYNMFAQLKQINSFFSIFNLLFSFFFFVFTLICQPQKKDFHDEKAGENF